MMSSTLRVRPLLHFVLPAPTRGFLWRRKLALERAAMIAGCRFADFAQRAWLWRRRGRATETIDYHRLRNLAPNAGPVPMVRRFESAGELVSAFKGARRRSQGCKEFEGFAPDDAVFDPETETHELWSNARLAGFIADFGYRQYGNPAILELGCGSAHLFFFLRRYGVRNYVGIDGNPHFIEFNPHLRQDARQFRILNLQEELELCDGSPLQFDIVCSFELAEHLRESHIDNLLRTIWKHMHRNSTAFVTASLQSNLDVHVLIRRRDWWLARFAKCGLVPQRGHRVLCRELANHHPWNWDATNTNVFVLRAEGQKEKNA